jgi:hypothetical protein
VPKAAGHQVKPLSWSDVPILKLRFILEVDMRRFGPAAVAFAIMSGAVFVGPASAQTKMDCSRLYKDFWEKMDREKLAKIPAERLAGVSRKALRAYDSCQAGDAVEAKALFDSLNVKLY